MLCNDSVRNKKCHKPNCKLYHLRWTDRGNQNNRRRQRHPPNDRSQGSNSQYSDKNVQKRYTPNGTQENYGNYSRDSRHSSYDNLPKNFLEPISRLHAEMNARFKDFENILYRSLHRQPLQAEKEFPYLTQEGCQKYPSPLRY